MDWDGLVDWGVAWPGGPDGYVDSSEVAGLCGETRDRDYVDARAIVCVIGSAWFHMGLV